MNAATAIAELASPLLAQSASSEAPLGDALLHDVRIERILKAVRGHLGLEIAFVARYVDDEREITHVDTNLALPMGAGYRERKDQGYCWHVLEGRLPELIRDPADHPLTQSIAITHLLPIGCHLNVPLRLSDGRVWGSFCALSRTPDRSMNERDMGVLRAFAGLAAEQIETSLGHDMSAMQARRSIGEVITGNRLGIVHQPIHALAGGVPVGIECLARFPDAATRGPDKWFGEAAEVGLAVDLEMAAVKAALASLDHLPQGFYASINASPETILSGALREALEQSGRADLVIEVTEHQQVDDFAALGRELALIKGHARIAIDDVGAGYAGLRHIVELAPDLLKLDMSLTRDINRDPARRALAGAMVGFAREIGCKLVAEGVETDAERAVLADLGVDYGQGWLFARPMPAIAALHHLMGLSAATQGEGAGAAFVPPLAGTG